MAIVGREARYVKTQPMGTAVVLSGNATQRRVAELCDGERTLVEVYRAMGAEGFTERAIDGALRRMKECYYLHVAATGTWGGRTIATAYRYNGKAFAAKGAK